MPTDVSIITATDASQFRIIAPFVTMGVALPFHPYHTGGSGRSEENPRFPSLLTLGDVCGREIRRYMGGAGGMGFGVGAGMGAGGSGFGEGPGIGAGGIGSGFCNV